MPPSPRRTASPHQGMNPTETVRSGSVVTEKCADLEAQGPLEPLLRHDAMVLDISQSGLRLILGQLPPRDRGLWICLDESNETAWTEVVLRSLAEPQPGSFLLGLSFVDSCP